MGIRIARLSAAIGVLALGAAGLWGQAPSPRQSGGEPSYLMRLERVREGLDVCVLVRGDGQYHLERHLSGKSRIFEGDLELDQLHQVIRIVSDDQLFLLRQNQIPESMLRSKFDEIDLAVLRPRNRWQILGFPDPRSREPYRKSLDPLISWLEKVEKRKGQELPEDSGRTNCTIPQDVDLSLRTREHQDRSGTVPVQGAVSKAGSPELKSRNAEDQSDSVPQLTTRPLKGSESVRSGTIPAVAALPPPSLVVRRQYLLRVVESIAYPQIEAAYCTVISPSGVYHHVSQNHDPGSSKVQNRVLDGHLNEEQLTSLGKILNGQEISKISIRESKDLSFVPPVSRNGFLIWISFFREGKMYEFEASRPYRPMERSPDDEEQEKEWQALDPLLKWLKKNMDPSKPTLTSNLSNGRCADIP